MECPNIPNTPVSWTAGVQLLMESQDEPQNGLCWKGTLKILSFQCPHVGQGRTWTPFTGSGCSKPHPACPWRLPVMGIHCFSGIPVPYHPHREELPDMWPCPLSVWSHSLLSSTPLEIIPLKLSCSHLEVVDGYLKPSWELFSQTQHLFLKPKLPTYYVSVGFLMYNEQGKEIKRKKNDLFLHLQEERDCCWQKLF